MMSLYAACAAMGTPIDNLLQDRLEFNRGSLSSVHISLQYLVRICFKSTTKSVLLLLYALTRHDSLGAWSAWTRSWLQVSVQDLLLSGWVDNAWGLLVLVHIGAGLVWPSLLLLTLPDSNRREHRAVFDSCPATTQVNTSIGVRLFLNGKLLSPAVVLTLNSLWMRVLGTVTKDLLVQDRIDDLLSVGEVLAESLSWVEALGGCALGKLMVLTGLCWLPVETSHWWDKFLHLMSGFTALI